MNRGVMIGPYRGGDIPHDRQEATSMARSPIPTPDITPAGPVDVGAHRYARTRQSVIISAHQYVIEHDGAVRAVCGRCAGRGILPHYAGIYNGECFECGFVGTSGKVFPDAAAAAKRERTRLVAAANRARKAEKAEADAAAAAAEWATENPDLARVLANLRAACDASQSFADSVNGPLYEIAYKATWTALTLKQAEFVATLVAERVESDHADAVNASSSRYAGDVGEKITVTGSVVVAKYIPSDYYGRSGSYLIVVDAGDGVTAKMFTAAAWADDVEAGDEVTVTGTVKEHEVYQDVKQTVIVRPKGVKAA